MTDLPRPSPESTGPGFTATDSAWPPTFSRAFVEQARRLLDHAPVLLIVGQPGSSRHLLASAISDVGRDSVRTRHLARHGESNWAYFALRQVIRDLEAVSGDRPAVVEARVRTALMRTHGRQIPTVILLEADLCDRPSLVVLHRLADSGVLRIIATTRPGAPSPHPAFADGAERVDLLPLDRDTVRDLLRVRFRLDPHPDVVELLREKSGGAYDILREIADTAFVSGALVAAEGVLVLDELRAGGTLARIGHDLASRPGAQHGSRPEVTDLLHLCALIGELEVAEMRQCFSAATVAEVLGHPSIRRDDVAQMASTAEARLIISTLSLTRKQALFDAYAACFPTSVIRPRSAMRSAEWFIAVGRALPVELARQAARQANLRGHHHRATAFTDSACSETGAVVAPLERAFALTELGEHRSLVELFASLDPAGLTAEELLLYTRSGAGLTSDEVFVRLPSSAIPRGADEQTVRARTAAVAVGELYAKAHDGADATLERRARSLAFSTVLSDVNRAEAFTTLSLLQRHAGHPAAALDSAVAALNLLAAAPGSVSAAHLDLARENHILALLGNLDFDGARQSLVVYGAPSARHGGMPRLGHALWSRLGLLSGDTELAGFHATLCVETTATHDPHRVRGWAEAVLVQILVHQDRRNEALAMLARPLEAANDPLQSDLERRIARACAHDSLGEPEEALDILDHVMVEARKHHLRLAEIDAAVLSVQVGGPDYLPELREAVDGPDALSGTSAVWRRFAAACGDWDFGALKELAVELDARGARLMAVAVAQYALDVARRADDLDAETRARLEHLVDPPIGVR